MITAIAVFLHQTILFFINHLLFNLLLELFWLIDCLWCVPYCCYYYLGSLTD
jgi:hypothetical protein